MALPKLPSEAGSAGTVSLVTPKGLDDNSIFLQILNLHTILFHVLFWSSRLQYGRLWIQFWALVSKDSSASVP